MIVMNDICDVWLTRKTMIKCCFFMDEPSIFGTTRSVILFDSLSPLLNRGLSHLFPKDGLLNLYALQSKDSTQGACAITKRIKRKKFTKLTGTACVLVGGLFDNMCFCKGLAFTKRFQKIVR